MRKRLQRPRNSGFSKHPQQMLTAGDGGRCYVWIEHESLPESLSVQCCRVSTVTLYSFAYFAYEYGAFRSLGVTTFPTECSQRRRGDHPWVEVLSKR